MAADARFTVLGTQAHVVVTAEPGLDEQLTRFAAQELSLMERRWSRFLPTSELSRLNAAAGKAVTVSADTFSVITSAVDAWKQTDGRFDPTVHDALCALGYDRTFADVAPDIDRPGTAAPSPGCADIEFDASRCAVRLPEGVRLDLGGIAKGAAADLLVGRLHDAGADGACVNVGGDIRVEGRAPTERGWIIDLALGDDQHRRVTLGRGAVRTSTRTRRRWVTIDGERHHIIDPCVGRSTEGRRWVSVIGARATQADDDNAVITEIGCLEELAA